MHPGVFLDKQGRSMCMGTHSNRFGSHLSELLVFISLIDLNWPFYSYARQPRIRPHVGAFFDSTGAQCAHIPESKHLLHPFLACTTSSFKRNHFYYEHLTRPHDYWARVAAWGAQYQVCRKEGPFSIPRRIFPCASHMNFAASFCIIIFLRFAHTHNVQSYKFLMQFRAQSIRL